MPTRSINNSEIIQNQHNKTVHTTFANECSLLLLRHCEIVKGT